MKLYFVKDPLGAHEEALLTKRRDGHDAVLWEGSPPPFTI